jgi:hypothetical protein
MGQCAGCHRGQHLTVHISTNDYTVENPHADGSAAPGSRPRVPYGDNVVVPIGFRFFVSKL